LNRRSHHTLPVNHTLPSLLHKQLCLPTVLKKRAKQPTRDPPHKTDVDSFHRLAHPTLPTTELHGFLRSTVCLTCSSLHPRTAFQHSLAHLNPAWATLLASLLANGALTTEDPSVRASKGLRTNPDGDVDLPDAPYSTFRYPACPVCLEAPPLLPSGERVSVDVDADGAWLPSSTGGVLKPAVVMFGESIPEKTKAAAEGAIAGAARLLVVGSSLATYSAWRLVKQAKELGLPIGVVNMGGVRGEDVLFKDVGDDGDATEMVRCSVDVQDVLPEVVKVIEERDRGQLRR
jgi:NAD-dependent SIR2 family protein deacetylase